MPVELSDGWIEKVRRAGGFELIKQIDRVTYLCQSPPRVYNFSLTLLRVAIRGCLRSGTDAYIFCSSVLNPGICASLATIPCGYWLRAGAVLRQHGSGFP